eukprot:COSAG02_NODE_25729_length_650_cov_14.996370_1_plen_47_part_10
MAGAKCGRGSSGASGAPRCDLNLLFFFTLWLDGYWSPTCSLLPCWLF